MNGPKPRPGTLTRRSITAGCEALTSGTTAPGLAPDLLSGFCELTLETSDPDRLEQFYRECFGCGVISRESDRVWLACGERARLGIWTVGPKEFGDRGGRHVHFALSASPGGFDQLIRGLGETGVAFQGPVTHSGGDRSIYIEDPEGNVVEVWDFFERRPGSVHGVSALT